MTELINRLNLDNGLKKRLISLIETDKDKINALAERCRADGFASLIKVNDLMCLAVCVSYAVKFTLPEYNKKGIDETIFYDTMQDISVWCENNGNKGLHNFGWIENHLKCELFRIGRLQFQLYKCSNKTLDYDILPFSFGDNLVYIHIPQGERLVYSDCVESLKLANSFFSEYFGDFEHIFYFCESWLLFEDNYLFMKPSCNILQFQSLFDIVYSVDDDSQAIERIFGKRHLIKSLYPEKTSLQKSAKKYMMNKNKLGIGVGIIAKYDI